MVIYTQNYTKLHYTQHYTLRTTLNTTLQYNTLHTTQHNTTVIKDTKEQDFLLQRCIQHVRCSTAKEMIKK